MPTSMQRLLRFRRKPQNDRFNLSKQDRPTWQERADDAVALWVQNRADWRPPGGGPLRIADLGAGNERLRDVIGAHVVAPHTYTGYDLEPQQPQTIQLDVLSELPSRDFDLAFCLGVLEYLPDDNDFLERLAPRCSYFLSSYVPRVSRKRSEIAERRRLGWIRHLDREAHEQLFRSRGYTKVAATTTIGGQTGLWLWATPSG
jgi:hypothetical protein